MSFATTTKTLDNKIRQFEEKKKSSVIGVTSSIAYIFNRLPEPTDCSTFLPVVSGIERFKWKILTR